jgi:hypothetical protein
VNNANMPAARNPPHNEPGMIRPFIKLYMVMSPMISGISSSLTRLLGANPNDEKEGFKQAPFLSLVGLYHLSLGGS